MKAYLISGRTGAGKTTIAKQLATEFSAFRISHDEMLAILYGREVDPSNFREYCERINQLIWLQVAALSKLNVSIVIEGFGSRPLRDAARLELDQLAIDYEFIYVDCPKEVRWQRVQNRNRNSNYRGAIITDKDFDRMEEIKEELDADETARVIDNSGHKDMDFRR